MADKGILVISFGTSYPETRKKTIDQIEEDFRKEFPDRKFYHAFSSNFIVKKLRKNGENIPSVKDAMDQIVEEGIEDLLIQVTHLMRAHEYDQLQEIFASYKDHFRTLKIGRPLLSTKQDVQKAAEILPKLYSAADDPDTCLVLMGHGTDHSYNQIYLELSAELSRTYPNILIGTVEAVPTLQDVIDSLHALRESRNIKKVCLAPLLVVAGDHATNDMASDEEDSWKSQISAQGFETECILKGLGEYPEIRRIYIEHAYDALHA